MRFTCGGGWEARLGRAEVEVWAQGAIRSNGRCSRLLFGITVASLSFLEKEICKQWLERGSFCSLCPIFGSEAVGRKETVL